MRPLIYGFAINRSGGAPGGKVYSQQSAEGNLERSIKRDLDELERDVIGEDPLVGVIPRLDAIARFLSERQAKITHFEFSKRTSMQPTIDECLTGVAKTVLRRIGDYGAKARNTPSNGTAT